VKSETQNRRLESTGLAKPSETRVLTGTGPGLGHQESAGLGCGRIWNRTDPFLRSKPGTLAGYPDLLLTLLVARSHIAIGEASRMGNERINHTLCEKIVSLTLRDIQEAQSSGSGTYYIQPSRSNQVAIKDLNVCDLDLNTSEPSSTSRILETTEQFLQKSRKQSKAFNWKLKND